MLILLYLCFDKIIQEIKLAVTSIIKCSVTANVAAKETL